MCRRIFAEPFPKALGRYARQTQRTRDSLLELARCISAEMAAQVARLLGFVTSPDSLIRLQRLERFPAVFPRVLGVDEFALRKGWSYGTLMVDLERRPGGRFEGIAAKDLTAWLQNHPQVEVLARDRAWAYRLAQDLRRFGVLRRDSPQWKALYAKRQAIERVFKSMKESRRLERHCVRGLRQVTLHSVMAVLAFQATALVRIAMGETDRMRWMVRQVA